MTINPYLFGFSGPNTLFGMRVVEMPRRPKMQLSEDCPVTPEFRKEMNAWLLDFFGTVPLIGDDNTAYVIGGGVVMMNPQAIAMIINIA